MRLPIYTKGFRWDYAKMQRSGRNIGKLDDVMELLIDKKPFLLRHRDHLLKGQWQHVRDCHVEGDWILLYQLRTDNEGNETITFHRTDNHENLFG